MHLCDSICHTTDNSCLGKYKYPTTHPLVKGHFPKNPLMMGVMQWASIEDVALEFCKINNITGSNKIKGNAIITKKDGSIATDIKGFLLDSFVNCSDIEDQADIIKTTKISFRQLVKPEETIYILLTDLQVL